MSVGPFPEDELKRVVIIFEDHTAVRFRPLAWGTPVYELGWGMFNLRERAAQALAAVDRDAKLVLLPRRMLAPLQLDCLPAGASCGTAAAAAAIEQADWSVFISARSACTAADAAGLLTEGEPEAWTDDLGLVAARLDRERAAGLLADWDLWDSGADEGDGWIRADLEPPQWRPNVPEAAPMGSGPPVWRNLWDRIPVIGEALAADIAVLEGRPLPGRSVFGAVPASGSAAPWSVPVELRRATDLKHPPAPGAVLGNPEAIWLGDGVEFGAGVVADAAGGPVILESGVSLRPGAVLEGPLWLGAGTLVKSGARIGPQVAAGPGCKLAGEIAESQIAALSNKQHDGFLGHSLLGSWVNLGAGTNNSDLKNNYSEIRIDCGLGPRPTGQRFLGLMMADHGKSAIGTSFNTGTTVGYSSNVFATGFPPKFMPSFTWGDGDGPAYDPQRALSTAAVVMERRGCRLTPAHRALFHRLAAGSR